MGRMFFRRLVAVSLFLLWVAPPVWAESPEIPLPGPKERCPVCGMFVAPFPNWTAVARFPDGSLVYFDGPKDMLRYTFDVGRFDPDHQGQEIESLWVTEYYTTALMPAAKLFFAVGSDVLGPMGHELVPILDEESARVFKVDHRSKKLLPFQELTAAVVSGLP